MLRGLVSLSVLLATSTSVQATIPIYSQCGGIGWTGETTCDDGLACTVTNSYFYQCLHPITTGSPTVSTVGPTTTSTPSSGVKYWFSFGDSYTQTGFNITTGAKPAVGNALGNPVYPGYTACGSFPNWIDLVTVNSGSTQVLTYNLAYGGATIDASLVAPFEPTVLSMTDQVNIFLNTAGTKPSYAPWTSTNSIFSLFIGINDLSGSYWQGGDRSAFSDTLLDAYFALVQHIYDEGGRIFLFITVPGVDRSPTMLDQAGSYQILLKSVIDTFNTKLIAKAAAFKSTNSGVTTYIYDANADLVKILNSPAVYGFKDATSFGIDTDEAWCNNFHVSPGVHKYFAQGVAAVLRIGGFFY